MGDVACRLMQRGDARAVSSLLSAMPVCERATVQRAVGEWRGGSCVAERGGVVGGVLVARMTPSPEAPQMWYIVAVAVKATWRGEGIGTLLLNTFDQLVNTANLPTTLHVQPSNEDAVRLYKRCSFSTSGEPIPNYYRGASDSTAILMEKLPKNEAKEEPKRKREESPHRTEKRRRNGEELKAEEEEEEKEEGKEEECENRGENV